jgi:hypothetical protein
VKLRRLRWVGHVARKGKTTTAYQILVGKPLRKRSFERPTGRWEDGVDGSG